MPAQFDLSALTKEINRLARVDKTRALPVLGATALDMVDQTFVTERDVYGNPWAALKPQTVKRKRGGKRILTDTGRLRRSMHFDVRGSTVVVGTNVQYAVYHGSTAARQKMPFRPFFPWRETNGQLELPRAVLEDMRDSLEALFRKGP